MIPQTPPFEVHVRQYEVHGAITTEIDSFSGLLVGWQPTPDGDGGTDYVAVVWSDGPMAMALESSAGTVWKVGRR